MSELSSQNTLALRSLSRERVPSLLPPTETTPDGVSRQGGTTCYDTSRSGGLEAALRQFERSAPNIVRIVGSCPDEAVCRRARAYLPTVLNTLAFSGSVLIGATDTRRISDPRSRVPSIPELAAILERKLKSGSDTTKPQVFGTVPINLASHLGSDGLTITADRMSDHSVRMHQGISKALWFPGRADYVWDLEAHGVADLSMKMLRERPELRYHLVMIGGGRAARLEYDRTVQELAREFPSQVRVTLLGDTGGITEKLSRRSTPACVNSTSLAPRALTKELLWLTNSGGELKHPANSGATVTVSRDFVTPTVERTVNAAPPGVQYPPELLLEPRSLQQRWHTAATLAAQLRQNLCTLPGTRSEKNLMLTSEGAVWDGLLSPIVKPDKFERALASSDRISAGVAALQSELHAQLGLVTRTLREQLTSLPIRSLTFKGQELEPGEVLVSGTERFLVLSTSFDQKTGGLALNGIAVKAEGSLHVKRRVVSEEELRAGVVTESAGVPPLAPGLRVDTFILTRERTNEIAPTLKLGDVVELGERSLLILESSSHGLTIVDRKGPDLSLDIRAIPWNELFAENSKGVTIHRHNPFQFPPFTPYEEAIKTLVTVETAVLACDPTRHLPTGSIIQSSGERFALVLSNGRPTLVGLKTDGVVEHDTVALLGQHVTAIGDLRTQRLSLRGLATTPDSVAGWRSLSNSGGLILYVDSEGKTVAHEEILQVKPASRDGRQLDYPWQQITALRVTHATGAVEFIDELRHELSLSLPPASLPQAVSVEVYPANGERSEQLRQVPQPAEQRNFNGPALSITTAFAAVMTEVDQSIIASGIQSSTTRVERLSRNLSEESLQALRGRDDGFEEQLRQQKLRFEDGRLTRELFQQFCGLIQQHDERAYTELTHLERALHSNLEGETNLAAKLGRAQQTIERIATRSGGALPELAAELSLRLDRLAVALELAVLPTSPSNWVEIYPGARLDQSTLEACAAIAEAATRQFNGGEGLEAKRTALQSGGGLIQNEYDPAYLLAAVQGGANLLVHRERNDQGSFVRGFAILHAAGRVPKHFSQLHPALNEPRSAYYEIVCSDQLQNTTSSLILARSAMVALQHTETRRMMAIINDLNVASQRAALRDLYLPTAEQTVVLRASDGIEMPYTVWSVPVDCTLRQQLPSLDPRKTRPRTRQNKGLGESEPSLLYASPHERSQMEAIVRQNSEAPFTRISIGVTSMEREAQIRLRTLIHDGAFDGLQGVISWGATQVITQRSGVWMKEETGGHQILQTLRSRVALDATVVGVAPAARNDPKFGQVVEVQLPDGNVQPFPVVKTDNQEASQLTVADLTMPHLIRPVVEFPPNYNGNLQVWHVEALRSAEFSALFSDQMVLFAGGGGTVRWEIEHLLSLSEKNPLRPIQLVLLKGLGGVVDTLCTDNAWRDTVLRRTNGQGTPLVHIIDIESEPWKLRELLDRSGRIDASRK